MLTTRDFGWLSFIKGLDGQVRVLQFESDVTQGFMFGVTVPNLWYDLGNIQRLCLVEGYKSLEVSL